MLKKIEKRGRCLAAAILTLIMMISGGTFGYAEQISGPGAGLLASGRTGAEGVTIYVSKRTKTLTLKQNGILIAEYPVSLGAASAEGDKKTEGDMRTPSGEFYICTRNDKSVAYLALGLSYPSAADAERGLADGIITREQRDEIVKANAEGIQPPWDTPLGGAIEIHGCRVPGGTTHGCVAVDNEAMNVLWCYGNLGVPVTIGP